MVINEETRAKLRRVFDLNLYEVKIWTALLSKGVSSAGELSNMADVPRSRTYDVLESLEKKGFVVMKMGKPIQYIALPPEDVIQKQKQNVEKEKKKKLGKIEDVKESDVMERVRSLYQEGANFSNPDELTGVFKGRDNIYNKLNSMIKDANKDVVLSTTEEGLIRKSEELESALEKAKEKGVDVKIAAPVTGKNKEVLNKLKEYAEVKHLKDNIKPGRFAVVDGDESMLMVLDDKELHPKYDLGVWLNSPHISTSFNHIFNQMWGNLEKR